MDIQDQRFDCLCRTCMNEVQASSDESNAKSQQWLTIFDSIQDCGALRIDELLSNAVPQIEVHLRNEELPKKICSECLQQLLSVYRFQQMCVQSEEKLRQWASKKSVKCEIATNETVSYPSKIFPFSRTFQNLEHVSEQEPIHEKTQQFIKLEVSSAADHLQTIDRSMEHFNDSQDNVIEFIKNEPIEDDEHNIESSVGDSMHSIISVVKDEALSVEFDGQEINVSNLKDERLTHAESKPYECTYCPLTFSSKTYVAKYKEIQKGTKRVPCDICGKSFRKSSLKPHKIIHSGEKPHKCKFCERRLNHVQPLSDHIRSHTGGKLYKCKYCERAYGSNSILAKHLRTHLGENIHRCEFCPLAFPSISELRLHFTTHKNEGPETRERNLEALSEEDAKLKLLISKEKTQQPWTEDTLKQLKKNAKNRKFGPVDLPSPSELPLHVTTYKNEYPEISAQNLKGFGEEEAKFNLQIPKGKSQQPSAEDSQQFERHAKENLRKHRLIHIDDKPYECPYCPLRFRTTKNVARHKSIHEGMEQEACDICGKNVKKSNLKQHKLNHSEEKPHKCEFCEKRFNHLPRLQVHMHKHTGEKPYKCKYCQCAFASSCFRARHLRIHLGDNVHRCKFCPLAFPAASELRLHVTTHKNEDPETRERNMKALSENEAKLMLKFPKRKTQQPQTANSR